VVTTNYDKLLERAYGSVPRAPTHRDLEALGPLLFDGSFFILKAHGDIDRPDSLILTERDYREIIHANPAFNEIFSALLLTKAVLFIGYSLSDPDFRLLMDRQLATFKGYIPDRYALMSGTGRVERDVLWRTAGIRVLSYPEGEHGEVLAFLKCLQEEVEQYKRRQRQVEKAPSLETVARPAVVTPANMVQPTPLQSTLLSLRVRDGQLDAAVVADDRTLLAQGKGPLPDLAELGKPLARLEYKKKGNLTGLEAREVGEALAQSLPQGVVHALEEVPPGQLINLHLGAEIHTLPWEWIYAGDNHLMLRNPVVRTPSSVSDAARGYPVVQSPARVLLIGDASGDLPGARGEAEEIVELYAGRTDVSCTALIGAQATIDAVQREVWTGDYDVIHFAGHAWFDDQEAYLLLHDFAELRASELRFLLGRRPPAILILNSHFTAFVPPGIRFRGEDIPVPGAEEMDISSGRRGIVCFMDVAAAAGAGAFIGCFASPYDPMAGAMGADLQRELLAGAPVALALHKARLASILNHGGNPFQYVTALLYVLSGYPELVLV
jgi:hypothetical protein